MSGVFTDLTLRDFSLGTNNLPLANTPKLRNRFGRWWNRSHPYDRLPTNEPEPLRETSFQEADAGSWIQDLKFKVRLLVVGVVVYIRRI